MYGDINVYEMKMPAHYVDMTADEMEYGGGWNLWNCLAAVAIVAACVVVPVAVPMIATYVAITTTSVAVGTVAAGIAGASTAYGCSVYPAVCRAGAQAACNLLS